MRQFKGYLKDFLEDKKQEIERLISFGFNEAPVLLERFQIIMPAINFHDPIGIVRLDDSKFINSHYVFKFPVTGTTDVLDYQPSVSVLSLPAWVVKDNEFWLKIDEDDLESMKIKLGGIIQSIETHFVDMREDIRLYNEKLPSDIQKFIKRYVKYDGTENNDADLEYYLQNFDRDYRAD